MHTVTRATIVWFVVAGISGVAALLLNLYRSALGGGNALPLTIAAYATTALAVVAIYRGLMSSASAQDRARRNADHEREVADRLSRWEGLRPRD